MSNMPASIRYLACSALFFSHAVIAYFLPEDTTHHSGTLMAWPTKHSVYERNVTATRLEIASIVQAIGKYEPVMLFVYNDTDNLNSAHQMLHQNPTVSFFPTFHVDSLWARDTGPVFVHNSRAQSKVSGVVLHFSEWGHKLPPTADEQLAKAALHTFAIPAVSAHFVSEGGALEVDGEGTMMATESSILNDNRNPGKTKAQIEREFKRLFGVTKTIWFKGSKGTDITDAHIDGLARFIEPGLIALTKPSPFAPKSAIRMYENAKSVLSRSTDAKGRLLRVVEVPEPNYSNYPQIHNLCIEYVNWYVVNGAVILAGFGDKNADANAKRIVQELYPNHVVEQVQLRELALQGGGIHCATQQIISAH